MCTLFGSVFVCVHMSVFVYMYDVFIFRPS